MNQRIRELAEQARVLSDQFQEQWKAGPSNEEFFQEKFAELIVRKCLDQCYNRGMNDELYAGQLKAASFIEQHFGVEE